MDNELTERRRHRGGDVDRTTLHAEQIAGCHRGDYASLRCRADVVLRPLDQQSVPRSHYQLSLGVAGAEEPGVVLPSPAGRVGAKLFLNRF